MSRIFRYVPIALLTGALSVTTACASSYYGPRDRGPEGYRVDVQRTAYDRGYREGLEEGRKDGRDGRPFSMERHDEFRDADQGYRRSYGDRDLYQRAYRDGFSRGYREAFSRYGRGYSDRDRDDRYRDR